jgi:hypothetical protein
LGKMGWREGGIKQLIFVSELLATLSHAIEGTLINRIRENIDFIFFVTLSVLLIHIPLILNVPDWVLMISKFIIFNHTKFQGSLQILVKKIILQ